MLDKKVFAQYITGFCEIYNKQPTKSLLELYYFVLSDMNEDEFKNSVVELLKTRKFATLPKPAEILEYSRPDVEKLAILAIDDIERAIAKGGVYSSVTFEDRVINSIIDHLGGWIAVCQMDLTEWKWAKKEIVKLYETYSKRSNHPTHLIGIAENVNGYTKSISVVKAGYEVPKIEVAPALNPPKHQAVMLEKLVQKVKVA